LRGLRRTLRVLVGAQGRLFHAEPPERPLT